jgi:hypothetical protein
MLVGTLLLEQNEEWLTRRKYMRIASSEPTSSSLDKGDLVSADQVSG